MGFGLNSMLRAKVPRVNLFKKQFEFIYQDLKMKGD